MNRLRMHRRGWVAVLAFLVIGTVLAPRAGLAQDADPKDDVYTRETFLVVPRTGLEVSVEELMRDVGEKLKKVVAIDEALRGKKVKFVNSAELNFHMLRTILSMYGVEIVFENVDGRDVLKVFLQRTLPTVVTPATPVYRFDEKVERWVLDEKIAGITATEQIVTAVYVVKYADANSVHAAIRAIMTRDPRRVGNIIYVQRSEALIITDLSSNVEFYVQIAQALDQKLPEFTYKLVQVQYALAEQLAQLVNNLTRVQAGGNAGPGAGGVPGAPQPVGVGRPGTVPGGEPTVVADARTNKVVILALPNDVEAIERLIRELDIKVEPPPRNFHVVPLINANAEEIAERLNALFTGATTSTSSRTGQTGRTGRLGSGTTGGGIDPRTGQRSSSGIGRQLGGLQGTTGGLSPVGTTGQPVSIAPGGVGSTGQPLNPGEALIETRIVADPQTNSLLIQATPEDFRDILALLKELDKKRLRVLIEAQVWEISLTDELRFGIEYAITDDAATNREPTPTRGQAITNFGLLAPTVDPANPQTISLLPNFTPGSPLSQGGFIFALTKGGFDRIPLILQALGTDSNSNLLTTPFALVNDNEEAAFIVEETQPFRVATAGTVAAFTGFDQARATSQLVVRPRVSSTSNLTLEIQLDIQSFTGASDPVSGAPPPSNARSYTGIVTIPNRQYIVFGGLEKEREVESRRKMPFLGDIPFLGYFFGATVRQKERTRIYVFVRPIIFADEDFHTEARASAWAHESIRGESLIGPGRSTPVIPDEVLDAEVGTTRGVLYHALGEPTPPFGEGAETRAARRQAAEGK